MVERSPEKAGVAGSIPALGISSMRIMFLCVENAGRSQMAEAFARKLGYPGLEVFSAGTQPAQLIHPIVEEVMQEAGMDLTRQIPKGLESLPNGVFDVAIQMGCGDACPTHRAKKVIQWEIPDPKGQSKETVRKIRDLIEGKVRELLSEF